MGTNKEQRGTDYDLDKRFENYCFLRLCMIDLSAAKRRVAQLEPLKDDSVRIPLLENVVVVYARPFSGNKGRVQGKHRLPKSHIPSDSLDLHRELIALRNELFAHSDATFHDPVVMRNIGPPEAPLHPVRFRVADFQSLSTRIPDLRTLFEGVEAIVRRAVDAAHRDPWFADAAKAGKLEHTIHMGSFNFAGKGPGTYTTPYLVDMGATTEVARDSSAEDDEASE